MGVHPTYHVDLRPLQVYGNTNPRERLGREVWSGTMALNSQFSNLLGFLHTPGHILALLRSAEMSCCG
jgi:hypothetical protein